MGETASISTSGVGPVATRLFELADGRDSFVVGLTGSVASGKSTLATSLAGRLSDRLTVETVSTDGFLHPNTVLESRGLMMRKGFPESYDRERMAEALSDLRFGSADFPGYSHVSYDVDPALTRRIERPDVLILEGLGFTPPTAGTRAPGEPDVLVFLEAELADIEAWFRTRFMQLWHAAADDQESFYARFRDMSEAEAEAFAMQVWREINLPNLTENILPLREQADIVLAKNARHSVRIVEDRLG